jgi:hypothetical protein
MVILESTANGHNWFKDRWDAAERGEGNYLPVFIGWQEDPNNVRAFADDEERERSSRRSAPAQWGEDEPRLDRGVRLHPRATALAPQRDCRQGQLGP